MPQFGASIAVVNSILRVVSYAPRVAIMLLMNIYGTGITLGDCHMMIVVCFAVQATGL